MDGLRGLTKKLNGTYGSTSTTIKLIGQSGYSIAEFSYNDKMHSSTKQSPFFINHGQYPRRGANMSRFLKSNSRDKFIKKMETVREENGHTLELATKEMK